MIFKVLLPSSGSRALCQKPVSRSTFLKISRVRVHCRGHCQASSDQTSLWQTSQRRRRRRHYDVIKRYNLRSTFSIYFISLLWQKELFFLKLCWLLKVSTLAPDFHPLPHLNQCLVKSFLVGSGGGSVGRAVATDTKDPRFKSQHRQFFSTNCTVQWKRQK